MCSDAHNFHHHIHILHFIYTNHYLSIQLECCGLDSEKDWAPFMNESLPMSCCKPENGVIGSANCTVTSPNVFREHGCMENLLVFVKEHAIQLGGAGLGIAFIQVRIYFSM